MYLYNYANISHIFVTHTTSYSLSLFLPPENTLLSQADPAQGIRSISERTLLDGYRLVSKIENTRDKLMIGFHQQFKLGDLPSLEPATEEAREETQ